MKLDVRVLLVSILNFILLILSFIFLYNDFIKFYTFSLIGIVCLFILLLILIFKKDKKTNSIKEVNKIKKTYDSLIVYVDDYNFKKKDNLYVNSIDELIEISKKNKKPVMYFNKDNSHYFIVENRKINIFKIEVSNK